MNVLDVQVLDPNTALWSFDTAIVSIPRTSSIFRVGGNPTDDVSILDPNDVLMDYVSSINPGDPWTVIAGSGQIVFAGGLTIRIPQSGITS